MDHLHTLNDLTPKVRCEGRAGVDPSLIFGLDSQLFQLEEINKHELDASHHESTKEASHPHHHEVQTLTVTSQASFDIGFVETVLQGVSKEAVYRIKGFIQLEVEPRSDEDQHSSASNTEPKSHRVVICNWAFGRYEFTPYSSSGSLLNGEQIRLTVMGERGSAVKLATKQLAVALGGEVIP